MSTLPNSTIHHSTPSREWKSTQEMHQFLGDTHWKWCGSFVGKFLPCFRKMILNDAHSRLDILARTKCPSLYSIFKCNFSKLTSLECQWTVLFYFLSKDTFSILRLTFHWHTIIHICSTPPLSFISTAYSIHPDQHVKKWSQVVPYRYNLKGGTKSHGLQLYHRRVLTKSMPHGLHFLSQILGRTWWSASPSLELGGRHCECWLLSQGDQVRQHGLKQCGCYPVIEPQRKWKSWSWGSYDHPPPNELSL